MISKPLLPSLRLAPAEAPSSRLNHAQPMPAQAQTKSMPACVSQLRSQLSDQELFTLCQEYGSKARFWRQKFAGLLPEVYRRKLFFQKGFGSIYEFAAKLAGMNEEQVRLVLNLEKKFTDKLILKDLLVNGEVSVHKLARVASIATVDNQDTLAEKLKMLPKSAIETLVRDEKYMVEKMDTQNQGLPGDSNLQQSLQNVNDHIDLSQRGTQMPILQLQLSDEVINKLLALQQKGININEFILELLQKREMEIAQEKEKIAAESEKTNSRYIPAKTRELLKKEFGNKCSIDGCTKNAEAIHHTQRFSIGQNHNPKFLAPLCKNHHVIAHSVDRKYILHRRLRPSAVSMRRLRKTELQFFSRVGFTYFSDLFRAYRM